MTDEVPSNHITVQLLVISNTDFDEVDVIVKAVLASIQNTSSRKYKIKEQENRIRYVDNKETSSISVTLQI